MAHALSGDGRTTARARPQPRGRGLDRLQHAADRAEGRRRRPHRRVAILTEALHSAIDLLASFIAFFSRPPRRGAGRRRPPLRPREVRERRRGRRGDADPRRLGGDRLRRDPLADQRPRARAPRRRHRRHRLRQRGQPRGLELAVPPRARDVDRRRWRATRRTCGPTPTRRSACSSASRWSASPARTGSTRSSRCIIAGAIVVTGVRITMGSLRVLVDEALPDDELDAIRDQIESFAGRGVVGYHQLRTRRAGARRYVDLHVQFRHGTTLEEAHRTAHAAAGRDHGRARRRRRADPPRARGPRAPRRESLRTD